METRIFNSDLAPQDWRSIFGANDKYLRAIEKNYGVTVVLRDGDLKLMGEPEALDQAEHVLQTLSEMQKRGSMPDEQKVNYVMSLEKETMHEDMGTLDRDVICHTVQGKPVKPKTLGQKRYADALRKQMVVFGVGPAGTGKTYLAIAMAVQAFKNQEVGRIILTRPAIEAGERLGYLPGDLQAKIDPYLRPLYDALFQIMGAENFQHHLERGEIEVAPLAYMRGRTLDNAYIILDEAQNTTPAQMKMFLTRIGFHSRCVVTGDRTQKDLPRGTESGLDVAMRILRGIEEISFIELTHKDVVRHPLVQKIVEAYERYDQKAQEKREQAFRYGYGRHGNKGPKNEPKKD
jgi:phosphate starvation-inducible PhoH-like protein